VGPMYGDAGHLHPGRPASATRRRARVLLALGRRAGHCPPGIAGHRGRRGGLHRPPKHLAKLCAAGMLFRGATRTAPATTASPIPPGHQRRPRHWRKISPRAPPVRSLRQGHPRPNRPCATPGCATDPPPRAAPRPVALMDRPSSRPGRSTAGDGGLPSGCRTHRPGCPPPRPTMVGYKLTDPRARPSSAIFGIDPRRPCAPRRRPLIRYCLDWNRAAATTLAGALGAALAPGGCSSLDWGAPTAPPASRGRAAHRRRAAPGSPPTFRPEPRRTPAPPRV